MLVTNGNSRLQEQGEMVNRAVDVVSCTKRGIGAELEAVCGPTCGEKPVATLLGLPAGVVAGMLLAVFETYSTLIGTARVSRTLGSEYQIS